MYLEIEYSRLSEAFFALQEGDQSGIRTRAVSFGWRREGGRKGRASMSDLRPSIAGLHDSNSYTQFRRPRQQWLVETAFDQVGDLRTASPVPDAAHAGRGTWHEWHRWTRQPGS